jgi:hypothetical protein
MVELTARRLRVPAVRAILVRGLTYAGVPIAVTACVSVGALGFANGGYFPVSWGWAALGLAGVAGIAVALGVSLEVDTFDLLFLSGLAGLGIWISASLLWTASVPRTVLENERMVVYLTAGAAGLLLLRRSSHSVLILGVWFAIVVVSTYGLGTRLFPDRLGEFNANAGYRLWNPVGYWNAFGILAAIGTLLALGLAARGRPVVRCAAAASSVVLPLTLYFTYSRGAWIAFFFGLAVAIALDSRRLQLVTTGLVLLPWPVLAIWAGSTSPALSREGSAIAAAARDGHGLAVIVIGLMVAAALTILVVDWLEAAVSVPHGVRRLYAGSLLFVLAASLIIVFGRYGFPPTLARKATTPSRCRSHKQRI